MAEISFEFIDIEVKYMEKKILEIDRLAIHQFDRIGIVGKNGAGKSTLLKLLAGDIEPNQGQVKRYAEYGYLKQMAERLEYEADAAWLGKLNVPKTSNHLSGGEETRQKLAQLFSDYHEALLIDEPTTHLDRSGIKFLCNELFYYYGALVLVSHDRDVLNYLVDSIWEIEHGKVTVYTGNYDDYLAQKTLEREHQDEAYEQYIKEKQRLEKAAEDKMAKAKKIAQAAKLGKKESKAKANRMFETKSKGTSQKSVQKAAKVLEQRLDQLEEVSPVEMEKPLVFHPSKALRLHNDFPIMADEFSLKKGEKVLLEKTSFQLPLGHKIALIGDNGVGKSTLLHAIANQDEALIISPKAVIGYFKQMSYQYTEDITVLNFIKSTSDYQEGFIRSVLDAMQFDEIDIYKKLKSLSGGEAVRLQLCHLFLGRYNIILLDEPTTFLDIVTIEALESFIKNYHGTIIFATHDRTFMNQLADVVYQIKDQKVIRQSY